MGMHRLQVDMLRAVCHTVDDLLEEHQYGEFLEAGMRLGRDVACRAADKLETEDRLHEQRVLRDEGDAL